MIVELNEINTNTEEGRLLLAAIAKITTSTHTDKTPNEVIEQLNKLSTIMFPDATNHDMRGANTTVDSLLSGQVKS